MQHHSFFKNLPPLCILTKLTTTERVQFSILFWELFCFWIISTTPVYEEVSTVFEMMSQGLDIFIRKSQRKTESWKCFRRNCWIFLSLEIWCDETLCINACVLLWRLAMNSTVVAPSQQQRLASDMYVVISH